MKIIRRCISEGRAQFSDYSLACEQCSCSLCGELQGTSAPLHMLLMPDAGESRVLWKTPNWVVIPTIGPLTPGHLMLVPRTHHYSILSCPEDTLDECQKLLGACAEMLRMIYGLDVLVFEHGATAQQHKVCGACIDHAHLHVVPGPRSFIAAAKDKLFEWESGATLRELSNKVYGSPYMLVGQLSPDDLWVRQCAEAVPSQLLRRILALELGCEGKWDWRKQPNTSVFLQTIKDWRARDAVAKIGEGQDTRSY
ncbi:MAG: HIT family protein [Pyrinomonadaceae bacterium]|nr:HIT family protein [Pyrinomonadaceae bacterium]